MNDQLKNQHEETICKLFLSIFNRENGTDLNFIRRGNPKKKEPDCICSNNFAIELAGAYENSYQAEKMWSVARNKKISKKPDCKLFLLDNLQNEIGIKLSKLNKGNYVGFFEKIILVLNLQSPLLQDKVVEDYVDEYVPFRQDDQFEKYFYQIWISWTSDKNGNWKIRKLE